MEKFGELCYGILVVMVTAMLQGFVAMTLWGWFVISHFQAAPLTFLQATGLMVFWTYLKPMSSSKGDEHYMKRFNRSFLESVIFALIILGMGFVITLLQ
jgi:hypothetical protein